MAAGAQVTPAKILRIAGNNTVLGENVPVGTLIIDVAAQKQYIVTAALGAGAKLSESDASLREMAAAAALGTLSAQSSDNVTISGGTITNTTITPGTGNVTASGFTGSGSTSGAVDLGTAEALGLIALMRLRDVAILGFGLWSLAAMGRSGGPSSRADALA